jgi:glutathione synthase/RimK-type ligase-like ATP-grasp enzyme
MTIYIDADQRLGTWRHIANMGHYAPYEGRARRGDVIIRWGCNHGLHQGTYPQGVKVLNRRIILSKREQGDLLQERGVAIPKIFHSRLSWERDNRPQLLIKPEVGQMGNGIRLIDRPIWRAGNIYQLYIEKQREFRAMMVGNLMAFFMEKHPPRNGDIRWNEHRGSEWTTVPENRDLRRRIKRLGYASLQALDYDFGACDIIMDGQGALYILEVNSRPEFEERNAQRFVNAIQSYLNGGGQDAEG